MVMSALRWALAAMVLLALAAKLVGGAVGDDVLGGQIGTVAAGMVEVAILVAVLRGRDRPAALMACGLCAAGVGLALLRPEVGCGCFGAALTHSQHLMVAGTMGVVAASLLLLGEGRSDRRDAVATGATAADRRNAREVEDEETGLGASGPVPVRGRLRHGGGTA